MLPPRPPSFPGLIALLLWTISSVFGAVGLIWTAHSFPSIGSVVGLHSIPSTHLESGNHDHPDELHAKRALEPPTVFSVPDVCLDDLRNERPDGNSITSCVDMLANLATLRKPKEDLCWPIAPYDSRDRLSDEDILSITPSNCSTLFEESIFHTVILGQAPSSVFGPFLAAFFATQCCSAELWIWTTIPLVKENVIVDYAIPIQHKHRFRILPFDASTHWRAMNGEEVFKSVVGPGRSGESLIVGDYMNRVDHANQADVVRMLLLHRYGGTYIDMDVLPLQDLRPLLALRPAITYRWSCFTRINTAVSHWGSCGSNISFEITSAVIQGMSAGVAPRDAYYNDITYQTLKRLNLLPEWNGRFGVVPSMLCDPLWTRLDSCEPPGIGKYNPEIRNFEGFYTPR